MGCVRTPPQAPKVRILILNIQVKECSRLNRSLKLNSDVQRKEWKKQYCIHWETKTSCTPVARAIQNISMSAQMSELIYGPDYMVNFSPG